jgi:hypothetical protein
MKTSPPSSSERQKPHSPDRHSEGDARLALSMATRTVSVARAGISLTTPCIFTFIWKVLPTAPDGKSGRLVTSVSSPQTSRRTRLRGSSSFASSASRNRYIISGPQTKKESLSRFA